MCQFELQLYDIDAGKIGTISETLLEQSPYRFVPVPLALPGLTPDTLYRVYNCSRYAYKSGYFNEDCVEDEAERNNRMFLFTITAHCRVLVRAPAV